VRSLGIIPSFFTAHTWYWGDAHIRRFGLERASQISPAASAQKEGILFTFHQDAPVIEPNMLETVWCAVNRRTQGGVLLGPEERIDVREAWKAVTISAAYQSFEEKRKGSVEVGKDADFVLLDRDPFAIDPRELREIRILRTIRRDVTVYSCGA
jgi:predicted amidohydrolase YtcJ